MDVPKAGEMRGTPVARRTLPRTQPRPAEAGPWAGLRGKGVPKQRRMAALPQLSIWRKGPKRAKRGGLSSKIERFGASHTNKVQKL